jgi:TFIIF-interacting CTD phosphatase-like protein
MSPRYDKLLVLDLDETLVYSVKEPLARTPDFTALQYSVYKRPGVDLFLSTCTDWFKIAVWTSSSPDYAHEVIRNIFPESVKIQFIFTWERCSVRFDYQTGKYYYVKQLKKLKKKGYSLKKILVIDDTPETFVDNYGNAIQVRKYKGEQEDDELLMLLKYLKMIGSVENVRKLEKRDWRNQV